MPYLRMSGRQILNELNFRRYFSPADMLRQKELAAGFVMQVMQHLSDQDNLHSYQLYSAVFQGLPCSVESCDDYLPDDALHLQTPELSALLQDLWDMLEPDDADDQETLSVFWILAAGYSLAQKTWKELPITREAALSAYRRELRPHAEIDTLPLSDDGQILLPAREKPYQLLLDPVRGMELLAQGGRIVPRRLASTPDWQGITSLRTILDISEPGRDDRRLHLSPGEYIFVSFVGSTPVYVHPVRVSCGRITMHRNGDALFRSADSTDDQNTFSSDRSIISFAPDAGGGWLAIDDHGLDASHYTGRSMNESFLSWFGTDAVEVMTQENGALILLDASGHIYSTDSSLLPADQRPVTSISIALKQKGADEHDG